MCSGGACIGGPALDCDDGNVCTDDSCDSASGCVNTNNTASCDDGDACTTNDACSGGACLSGAPLDCDDGDVCTDDSCESSSGCVNSNNTASCEDGIFCNGAELCAGSICGAGTPVDCDDGVVCTADSCNEGTDTCDHVPDDVICTNDLFCDGAETCDSLLGCRGGTDPCPGQDCDEDTDTCIVVECQSDVDCDDSLFCNGVEACVSGTCQPGPPVDCGDGVACTVDSCNEATDSCDHVPNDADCDNGMFCDGAETCDSATGCQAGTPVDCNDGVACTDDSCNEAADSCDHVPNDGNCDNALFCDGVETCHSTMGCQTGAPVDCADGAACTDDSCNEGTDSCDHVANDANCDNGLFCDGVETCDPVRDCQAGTDPCPGGACDEDADACVTAECQSDNDCTDGLFCNGVEVCVSGACQAGTPVDCADGISCTNDSCNEATDSCDNIPDDALCEDGQFCTGTESCNPSLGCVSSGNPCPTGTFCNEAMNTCDDQSGEDFILSKNPDFSTDDREFSNQDTLYMLVRTNRIDFHNLHEAEWRLKDQDDHAVGGALVNHFDGTYTASFDLSGLPSDAALWAWRAEIEDNNDNEFEPTATISVSDAACMTDADCDDDLFCNGVEVCVSGTCQAGGPIDCADGISCTDDSCNEATDSCDHVPNNADCDNGLFCDGVETCSSATGCQAGTDPCPGQACDEDADACVTAECQSDNDCSDDLFCNGVEDCVDGKCLPGDDPCPEPDCDEVTDTCVQQQPGETFILSRNPDFSTNDRTFGTSDTIYMLVTTDRVDFNDIEKAEWELRPNNSQGNKRRSDRTRVKQPLVNHFDGTYTASFDPSQLPSDATSWEWKARVEDDHDMRFRPRDTISVTEDGGPAGEGLILSKNPDFSTNDRDFARSETIYMLVWSDRVNSNSIREAKWELKDDEDVKEPLLNNFDGTYTASFALSELPSDDTLWTWRGTIKDDVGRRFRPIATIMVMGDGRSSEEELIMSKRAGFATDGESWRGWSITFDPIAREPAPLAGRKVVAGMR